MILNMHPEAITSEAKKLIKPLSELNGFYLAGGTGLALQLGHRISIDFDFFTPQPIKGIVEELANLFNKYKINIIVNQPDQFTAEIGSVQTSFIQYPFPIFTDFVNWQGIKILKPNLISAMKAYALGRRATFKDYLDLYFVLNLNIVELDDLINIAKEIYQDNFNDRLFLEQLIYLEDIQEEHIEFIGEKVSKEEVKNFFRTQIENYELS